MLDLIGCYRRTLMDDLDGFATLQQRDCDYIYLFLTSLSLLAVSVDEVRGHLADETTTQDSKSYSDK